MSQAPDKLRVGIVGGTGYTGAELLRFLVGHPHAEVVAITSRSEEGVAVSDMYPNLRGHLELHFTTPDVDRLAACDVVFFATPHNVAMRMMPALLAAGARVIDLSADFRLRDADIWSQWYGEPHVAPELLREAVYGLPEMNRDAIRDARLVACPGCYPTAIQLGYLPLLESGWVETSGLIASCASGVSGAGRQAKVPMLLAEASGSFKAYGASGHRHLPEIRQSLGDIAGTDVGVTFVPHLLPMVRGIHATLYSTVKADAPALDAMQAALEKRYEAEPFVDVMPAGSHPETRFVKGANMCRIALHRPEDGDTLIVLSVIDNLAKGAAGQAIQNMNIMFGFSETAGLEAAALLP
ncbi:MAG: N-acetyl-gamma-glutamyl-phosphate reductase [Alcanivoracaceae bacterium]|nr:N-acetyl-gamma-glutamyl-phosphate reductase [Alcanivoracaceae bacterium]